MAISKTLRYEVFRRDNHACRYCGAMAPDAKLTVDHVVPTTLGGTDEPSNLVTACSDCNSGKSAIPPDAPLVDDIAQDALRWRRAMEAANEMAAREREVSQAYVDAFQKAWNAWTYEYQGKRHTIDLPGGWERRIRELMQAGLPLADMQEAVRITMGRPVKDEFAYFIGVTRQQLAQRQSIAAEMIRRGLV
jgi:hypothetical protein